MEQGEILTKLTILAEAQVGYKLCITTGKWYPGNGIFNALYRTVSGESRKDILDLMDVILDYMDQNPNMDVITKNTFLVSIPLAITGCENIIETYKDDDNYVKEITTRVARLNKFKGEQHVQRRPNYPLENGVHGNKAILQTVNMVLANSKAGSNRMDNISNHL